MRSVREAGAIVVRASDSGPLILLVTAKRNPHCWIFPKGHVEGGETLEAAAAREAEEEGGVTTAPVGPAGRVMFDVEGVTYDVHYFVLVTRDHGSPEDGRRLAWLPYDAAIERLTYESTQRLLRDARPLVDAAVQCDA